VYYSYNLFFIIIQFG